MTDSPCDCATCQAKQAAHNAGMAMAFCSCLATLENAMDSEALPPDIRNHARMFRDLLAAGVQAVYPDVAALIAAGPVPGERVHRCCILIKTSIRRSASKTAWTPWRPRWNSAAAAAMLMN